VRVLVVDDNEMWRRFLSTTLQKRPGLSVISEASDGLVAVQQAQQLQPNLILLDIGLPTVNGIETARRIREVSPASKILFVSENRSKDIAEQAMRVGASGYVVKSDAANELLPALKAVFESKKFVSASLSGHYLAECPDGQTGNLQWKKVEAPSHRRKKVCHEVEFYVDDAEFVAGFARFIEAALRAGSAVIVVATESHQADLFQRLTAEGIDMAAELEQGRYIQLDAADTLSSIIVGGLPDPGLFRKLASDLITRAARGARGRHSRVAACGEGVHKLLAAGNVGATIKLEHLWHEIAQRYEVDVLCGYFRSAFEGEEHSSTFERICAEHSAVLGREPFS
jgi:DNA-binding NarL/FixJ family response regulator